MVTFEGPTLDQMTRDRLAGPKVAGVTLFRTLNIESAEQTRRLTADIQQAAGRQLLIAVDQEGGQLVGAGSDTTPFAGNMALGATGDTQLVERVGAAIGAELRALGITVDYAPVADVATQPDNPGMGIRSFGSDPEMVARMTAAMVGGLQGAGVAATLKHFPGKGEANVDPHYQLPVLDLDLDRLEQVEFAPFRAGIGAGAKLVMVGHYGLPAVTGDRRLPASASAAVLDGLLRRRLRFEGVIITDALDMGAYGDLDSSVSVTAGADLLLFGPRQTSYSPFVERPGGDRVRTLGVWLEGFSVPGLEVVGCAEHRALAGEVAGRAITLVRDRAGLLPLRITSGERVLSIMPRPTDLTPADTSSLVEPGLAVALRGRHPNVTEMVVGHQPGRDEISAAVEAARRHQLVVVGTIAANKEQAALVSGLLHLGVPTVTVALRTPYDLTSYPQASTHLCTYSLHPPSMQALVEALFGEASITGRLPAAIPGLYPTGHGIELTPV